MSTARKVLLVDDDDDLRTSLKDQLVLHDEFEVSEAGTATKGMEAAKSGSFDLVVFDVGLPDMDGREAVKQLRKSGFKTPIVMLTGNTSDADQILGLDAGANDYVLKPFKFAVLLARIRAQLRQHEQSEDAIFAIGHYTFKPASKLLIDQSGSKIRLTEKETSILKYLFRSGDKVVSRDVLLHEVWGYNAGVTTHTLETHIYRLASENRERSFERRTPDHRKRRLQARTVINGVRRIERTACRALIQSYSIRSTERACEPTELFRAGPKSCIGKLSLRFISAGVRRVSRVQIF